MTRPAIHPMRAERRLAVRGREREEREDAALAAVVGPHDEGQVLDRDHHRERPEDERQDAEEVLVRRRDAVLAIDALAERVERARSDVAEDDAGGHQHQLPVPACEPVGVMETGPERSTAAPCAWRMSGGGCHERVGSRADLT